MPISDSVTTASTVNITGKDYNKKVTHVKVKSLTMHNNFNFFSHTCSTHTHFLFLLSLTCPATMILMGTLSTPPTNSSLDSSLSNDARGRNLS